MKVRAFVPGLPSLDDAAVRQAFPSSFIADAAPYLRGLPGQPSAQEGPGAEAPGPRCCAGRLRRKRYPFSTETSESYSTSHSTKPSTLSAVRLAGPAPTTLDALATSIPLAGEGVGNLHGVAAVTQPEREGHRGLDRLRCVAQGAVVDTPYPSRRLRHRRCTCWSRRCPHSSPGCRRQPCRPSRDHRTSGRSRHRSSTPREPPRRRHRSGTATVTCVRVNPPTTMSLTWVTTAGSVPPTGVSEYRFGGGISASPAMSSRAYHIEVKRCRESAAPS